MVIKSTVVLQNTLINFNQPQFQTDQTKNLKNAKKNTKNCNILGSKTPKNDILTLNYGLLSSFTTLSS